MHRRGHVGIVLLGLAPVLYVLLQVGRPILALLACGVLVIEPLPDYDQRVPVLTHRGISHSLATAVLVGILCAAVGWLVGTYASSPVADWLHTTAGFACGGRLAMLDALTGAGVGLFVGSGGIVLHLLGDVITVSGIQPFRPFSQRVVSLSSLYANSRLANGGLFLLGVLAIVLVALTATPLGTAVSWSLHSL